MQMNKKNTITIHLDEHLLNNLKSVSYIKQKMFDADKSIKKMILIKV